MTYPAVPLGNQFTHPHLEDGPHDLTNQVDARLNQLRTGVASFGVGLAQLRVARRLVGNLVSGVQVVWDTIITDSAGGYNVATGVYTVPGPGTYLVQYQLKQSTATSFGSQLVGLPAGVYSGGIKTPVSPGVAGTGPVLPLVPVNFLGGELVSVVPSFAAGTVTLPAAASIEANWLSIMQVA